MSVDAPPRRIEGAAAPAECDEVLVARLRAGDVRCFEAIFRRHEGPLLSYCRHVLGDRTEAEDALQQAFIRAHGALLGDSPPRELRPWLYAIARNCCLTAIAARRPMAELEDRTPSLVGLAEQVQERQELRDLVADIAGLPEEQRSALLLSELEDLSHAAIAGIVGCPVSRVKALVYQARSSLIAQRAAREASCEEIRERLAVARGGELRRGPLRRHLSICAGCSEFQRAVATQRGSLAVVLPVLPSVDFAARVLGHCLATGAGVGAGAAATGAGGAAGGGASGAAGVAATTATTGAAGAGGASSLGTILGGGLAGKLAVGGAVAALATAGAVTVRPRPAHSTPGRIAAGRVMAKRSGPPGATTGATARPRADTGAATMVAAAPLALNAAGLPAAGLPTAPTPTPGPSGATATTLPGLGGGATTAGGGATVGARAPQTTTGAARLAQRLRQAGRRARMRRARARGRRRLSRMRRVHRQRGVRHRMALRRRRQAASLAPRPQPATLPTRPARRRPRPATTTSGTTTSTTTTTTTGSRTGTRTRTRTTTSAGTTTTTTTTTSTQLTTTSTETGSETSGEAAGSTGTGAGGETAGGETPRRHRPKKKPEAATQAPNLRASPMVTAVDVPNN